MDVIPNQLNNFRFIRLKPDSKEAMETGFTEKNNYSLEEIKGEKSCGVLIGKDHVVIDIDNKWMANILTKENIIPETLTVKTPGKQGFHFYYKCKDAKARNLNMAGVGIGEIRTGNQYVLAPNSVIKDKKYEIIKDLPLTEITPEEIEEKFKRYITWDSNKKLRPCFLKALKEKMQFEEAEGHEFRTALACEARANGLTEEETVALFCYQNDFSNDKPGEKSEDHVKIIFRKKLKPWKCETIGDKCPLFTDCDDCILKNKKTKDKKEEKEQIEQVSKLVLDGQLWEQIYDPETQTSKFISLDKNTQKPVYEDFLIKNEIKHYPINDDLLKNNAVILPTGIMEYGDEIQLDKEIMDHIKKYVDVSPEHLQKATWYCRLSWVTDNLHTMPYLRALGDYGTGKTRYEDVIGGICYKPMYVGGSVRAAPIYRVINLWRGTAIFDEFTLRESDETTDIIQILNNGFQRGKPVLRCKDGDYSKVECFDPFGAKILACRQPFKDMALESRCITEIIKETTRTDIPTDLGATYYKERNELQNKLLFYRLKNWDKVIPDEKLSFDFGRIQPRIKQTFLPFTVLFQYDELVLKNFIETVKAHSNKLTEENSSSYDGLLINSYFQLLDGYGNAQITTQDIRNILVNEHGYEADKTNARTVGKHLKTLGFTSISKRIGDSVKRIVEIDSHTMKRLIYRYVDNKEQERCLKLFDTKKAQKTTDDYNEGE